MTSNLIPATKAVKQVPLRRVAWPCFTRPQRQYRSRRREEPRSCRSEKGTATITATKRQMAKLSRTPSKTFTVVVTSSAPIRIPSPDSLRMDVKDERDGLSETAADFPFGKR